jgi:hypothetical protein
VAWARLPAGYAAEQPDAADGAGEVGAPPLIRVFGGQLKAEGEGMTIHYPRRSTLILVWLLGFALLIPSSASAQAIRVLLVVPSEPAKLARQVSRFNETLGESRGPLVSARSLSEADAVVQFTKYRRAFDQKGESEDWWEGEFQLLTPPVRGAQLAAPPKPFMLLVIGREDWQVGPAVELLARTLARALGREHPSWPSGSI